MPEKLDILERAFGEYQKVGKEYMFMCPEGCHETKKKLSINLEKNVYKCWICDHVKGGDIRFLILKYAKHLVKDWNFASPPERVVGDLIPDEERRWFFVDWKKWNHFLYHEWDKQSDLVKEYLAKKRITPKTALVWSVRVSQLEKDTLLLPSFGLDGDVTYFSKRKFSGDYKFFKPNAPFDIFNEFWLNFKKPVYLVENAFDAMRFDITEVMPILGSDFWRYNSFIEKCIQSETTVNIFLDCDAEEKSYKIFNNLLGMGINAQIVNNIFHKDIEELDDWQVEFCKRNFIKNSDVLSNYVRSKLL